MTPGHLLPPGPRRPFLASAVALAAFAVLAPTLLSGSLSAQEPLWGGDLVRKADSMAAVAMEEGPAAGLAIGIKKGDELLLARGYGMADVENSVPVDASTVFRIGSVTKQFTAAAVMQLVESGDLSLDDLLTDHLPDYPTQGHDVTIRHLLTHTSGIKSYTSLDAWRPQMPLDLSDEELVALFQDEPFDFEPGERYLYNNSAYYLLGMIIEEVSGLTYRDYVRERLFESLGLSDTWYCDERPIIPGRAEGYSAAGDELRNDDPISMSQPGAAGALCSTVPDLLSWATALRSGDVVSAASFQEMTTPASLNDGSETGYGFGLGVGEYEGHARVSHGGGINGFNSMLAHYPESDLDVVVLVNTGGPWANRVAEALARWALGLEVVSVADLPLTQEERAVYEGVYELRSDFLIRVFSRGDELLTQATGQNAIRIRAQGDHVFVPTFDDRVRIVFEVEDGRATGLVLHQGGQVIEAPRRPDR